MLKSYIVLEAKMCAIGVFLEKAREAKTNSKLAVSNEKSDGTCTIEFEDTYRFHLERSDVDATAASIFSNGIDRNAALYRSNYDIAYAIPRIADLVKLPFIKLKSDLGYAGNADIEMHGRNYAYGALNDAGIFVKSCNLHVDQDDIAIVNAALDLSFTNVNNDYYARLADSYAHVQHTKTQIEELRGKDASTDKVKLGKLLRELNTQQLEYDKLSKSKIHAHCYVNLFGYAYHATATP